MPLVVAAGVSIDRVDQDDGVRCLACPIAVCRPDSGQSYLQPQKAQESILVARDLEEVLDRRRLHVVLRVRLTRPR